MQEKNKTTIVNFREVIVPNNTKHKLYRGSTPLNLNTFDLSYFQNNNITTIIDLRTQDERKREPSFFIAGLRYLTIDVLKPFSNNLTPESIEKAKRLTSYQRMNYIYESFASNPKITYKLKDALTAIAYSKGNVYFHCTHGKDRTGILALLLQQILGLDEETIAKDYLLTNSLRESENQRLIQKRLQQRKPQDTNHFISEYQNYLTVNIDYLTTFKKALIAKYETFDNYLFYGLQVSETTIDLIKKKFK